MSLEVPRILGNRQKYHENEYRFEFFPGCARWRSENARTEYQGYGGPGREVKKQKEWRFLKDRQRRMVRGKGSTIVSYKNRNKRIVKDTVMKSAPLRNGLIFILLVLFIPNLLSAESKTFIKEYVHLASEYDNMVSCRTLALEQVKRLLLEELGTYLVSETEVKNYKLTNDKIKTYTAGIVQTKIISETWDTEHLKYWVKVSIVVDPQDVVDKVNSLRQDLQMTRELEETRKKRDELSAEVERLKIELSKDKTNKEIITQYMKAIEGINTLEMFHKGIELSISGKLQEAIQELSNAIKSNPRYSLAYAIRAHLETRLGENNAAIEDSNKAIELDPNSAFAYVGRSYIYYRIRDYEKGLNDANRAIGLDPNYSYAYVMRGALLYGFHNFEKQLEACQKAIKLSPDNAHAYLCRGSAHAGLGNKIRSYLDVRKATNLDPNSAEVYIMRALLERTSGNYKEGLDYMDKAIKLDPYNAQAYLNRGMIYVLKKEYNLAASDFNATIKIAPKYASAYLYRSAIYLQEGNYLQAASDCSEAIKLDKKRSDAYLICGTAYYMLGNYQQSIDDFHKFIHLASRENKRISAAHATCGDAYSKLGNNEKAINEWQSAAKLGHRGAQNFLKKKNIDW